MGDEPAAANNPNHIQQQINDNIADLPTHVLWQARKRHNDT